jgi:hypothetical protein
MLLLLVKGALVSSLVTFRLRGSGVSGTTIAQMRLIVSPHLLCNLITHCSSSDPIGSTICSLQYTNHFLVSGIVLSPIFVMLKERIFTSRDFDEIVQDAKRDHDFGLHRKWILGPGGQDRKAPLQDTENALDCIPEGRVAKVEQLL